MVSRRCTGGGRREEAIFSKWWKAGEIWKITQHCTIFHTKKVKEAGANKKRYRKREFTPLPPVFPIVMRGSSKINVS